MTYEVFPKTIFQETGLPSCAALCPSVRVIAKNGRSRREILQPGRNRELKFNFPLNRREKQSDRISTQLKRCPTTQFCNFAATLRRRRRIHPFIRVPANNSSKINTKNLSRKRDKRREEYIFSFLPAAIATQVRGPCLS